MTPVEGTIRAALTIGLGGAEAPGPKQGGGRDWLWSRLTGHW